MAFNVVGALLSDVSQARTVSAMRITNIPRDQIHKNDKNGYKVGDVTDLAEDIKRSGLAQPLEVLPTDDGYRLLTGERRLTAIDTLIASGDWTDKIPCVLRELEDYELPISDDAKEMYAIIRTNRFTRKMTDADIYFEALQWQSIITELRSQGSKTLAGAGENGEDVSIEGRTRDVTAELMDISGGQLAKINFIDKNGTETLKDAIHDGRISIASAHTLSAYPKEEQDAFLTEHPDEITPAMLKQLTKKEGTAEKDKKANRTSFPAQFLLELVQEKRLEREKLAEESAPDADRDAEHELLKLDAIIAGLELLAKQAS